MWVDLFLLREVVEATYDEVGQRLWWHSWLVSSEDGRILMSNALLDIAT